MAIKKFGQKRKVCVVVASRANYGRIKYTMKAIKENPDLELQLVVGASALLERFGDAKKVIESDGFTIDAEVHFILEGATPLTMAKSTGLGLMELPTIFNILKPDFVVSIADRFETIATAISATYMNIPLAHTQGGEITGSIDESVRHAITKLAHIHFPATELSRQRVIRMGENPKFVFNTGCPAMDALVDTDFALSDDFFNRAGGIGHFLDPKKPYIVVMQHPVTTEFEQARLQITQTMLAISALNLPTVVLWPNVDAGSDGISKGIRVFREHHKEMNTVQYIKNLPVEDYARLMKNSLCVIGNTSSGLREGAFLGVPVVNVGTRQNCRERGKNVIDADYDYRDILQKARAQIEHGHYEPDHLFGDGAAGKKMADILASIEYVDLQKKLTY